MDTTVILVDDNDNFAGYEKKEVAHSGNGKRHRAIAIFLFNKKGHMLLQKRKHKRWDNVWDMAGATDVLHANGKDESYEESASRCMKKEWYTTVPLKKLFPINYFQKYGNMCENEHCMILTGVAPDNIKFNPEVAYAIRWASPEEIKKEMKTNPEDFTPWFLISFAEYMKKIK